MEKITEDLEELKKLNKELFELIKNQKEDIIKISKTTDLTFGETEKSKNILKSINNYKYYKMLLYSTLPLSYILYPKLLLIYPVLYYIF